MPDPIIKVENLGKKYNLGEREPYLALRDIASNFLNPKKWIGEKNKDKEFWALDDINFEVQKGEVIGVIGHNGAGKSTLLKILSKITPPTKGQVELNGRVASLLEVGTGFHPELTGRENIFLNGAILGMRKNEIQEKFDAIVKFAEIEKFLDTPVKRYSSGMYVRLAFAVAAHLEPEILLVDEVLAVGDINFQKKCLGKMDEVTKQDGRTILFVSHNMGAVQKLCKKTILLENGKIKMIGGTKEVIDKYIDLSSDLTKIPLESRTDRRGNGKIKLINFYITNFNNQKIPYIQSGEDAILNFQIQKYVPEKINNINLDITIRTAREQFLILHKTSYKNKEFSMTNDDLLIQCRIKKFPLVADRYVIGTEVISDHKICDVISTASNLEVIMGDFFNNGVSYQKDHSPVLIDGEWEIIS